jgi:hypothetical protein
MKDTTTTDTQSPRFESHRTRHALCAKRGSGFERVTDTWAATGGAKSPASRGAFS